MTAPYLRFAGHRGSINTLLCDDKKHANILASGSDDGTCRLWDLRTSKSCRLFHIQKSLGLNANQCDEYTVNGISYGSAMQLNNIYITAGRRILTYDLRMESMILTVAQMDVLQANEDEINELALHPGKDGTYLAAPDDTGKIYIYDIYSHRLFKTLGGQHTNICMTAKFRPNHAPWDLVSGGLDCNVIFWDFSRGRVKYILDFNTGAESLLHLDETASGSTSQLFNPPLVNHILFAPNGKVFAVALGDGNIAVVDFTTRRILYRLKGHSAAISKVHIPSFQNQEWLISSGNDAKICIWKWETDPRKTSDIIEINSRQDDNIQTHPLFVKEFNVLRKPNDITSSLHQNFLHICDTSTEISCFPIV